MVRIEDGVALVTGANRGIGRGFVEVLLERGARRIYATARELDSLQAVVELDPSRVVPLRLDIANADHRREAAAAAPDVNILVNNAGIPGSNIATERRFLSAETLDDCRHVLETNFFGPTEMCRSFAPLIIQNGSGAILNILSIGALFCSPETATYCVSKAAASVMTQGIRAELYPHGVFVAAVYTGGVDTRLTAGLDVPTISPVEHGRNVLDEVDAGVEDIFPGEDAVAMRDLVMADPKGFERAGRERFYSEKAWLPAEPG